MQPIQEVLDDLMLEKDMSTFQLSKEMNMDYKQLSNYVKGRFSPSLKSAIKLADFFQCSLDYLCGLTDHRTFYNYSTPDFLFFERYKKILKERNITHYKLAKETDINVNDLRLWKHGKIPTLYNLIKIADYLSISIDGLIGRIPLQDQNSKN